MGIEENVIIREDERLAVCALTIPISIAHSARAEILVHVYTEALRAGAGSLTREQFLDAESKLGSHIQVSGDSRDIRFAISALDTNLLPTLKLFELMVTKPLFAARELARIKELLTNALILSKEDAKSRAFEGFVDALTDKSDARFVFTADELIKEIKTVTIADLKKLHKTIFESVWILTSAGSLASTQKILKSVQSVRGKNIDAKKKVHDAVPFKVRTKRAVLLTDIPHKQNIEFSIGNTLALTREDSEFPAFVFGMAVLALYGGFSGRLMSTVREKEGLTYSIYGQTEKVTKTEQGFWRIATFFAPKDAVQGITATLREIKLLIEKGITEDELKRFKAILNTRAALVNDSIVKKVREVHSLREISISDEEFEAYKVKMQKMTTKEVHSALQKYLTLETLTISGAGPIQSIKKELEKCI